MRKDGTRFWAHVAITAIYDGNGDVEGFGKLTRDLTPVKQAEEQRSRAFALCLPQCATEEGIAIVDRIRELTPEDRTCSAGVARWDGEEPVDRLFGRADQALYRAKATGRNRTVLADAGSPTDARIIAVH